MKNLTTSHKLLLASIVSAEKKKELRETVKPGKTEIDLAFHFKGTLTIGEDSERAPTVSIPLLETMALFLARAGATREASEKLLVECMSEAVLQNGKGKDALLAENPDLAAMLERVRSNVIDKLPKVKLSGSVKWKGEIAPMREFGHPGRFEEITLEPIALPAPVAVEG